MTPKPRRFGNELERGEFVDSARVMSRREYLKKREDMMLDLRGRQLRDKEAILAGEKSAAGGQNLPTLVALAL